MMLNLAHLSLGRERLVEVAAPLGWVFALAEAAHLRPVQDRLDAACTRDAVSGFSVQIGSGALMTRPV